LNSTPELVVCNEDLFRVELFDQIMDLGGYSASDALALVKERISIEKEVSSLRRKLSVPRFIPASYIEGMPKEDVDKFLFNKAGFDTIGYQWVYDICCYTFNGKQDCGRIVIGQERLDDKWRRSGNMSDDAFYYLNREVERDGMKHDVK